MLSKRLWGIGVAIAIWGAFGVAAAQETAPAPPADVTTQRDVKLSPTQMRDEAETYLPEMERGASTVRRQLSGAREKRDVVKVLCLNDKLNQVDVATRSARDRMPNLRGAAEKNNSDSARHEFTVIQVLRDRVRSLVAEANQCIGEETGFVGDTQVTVDVDPTLPDDPSIYPNDPILSQPPVIASPTK
ncbi:MAG: hypothetical protein IPI67_41000 [Myxococcales bacterium]|nr:hypothetical protein [Myxococcales bacterium]